MHSDIKDISKFAHNATIPLLAFNKNSDSCLPDAFGCGFLFIHNNKSYLITTAHLITDLKDDEDSDKIINGINNDLQIGIYSKIKNNGKTNIIYVHDTYSVFIFTQVDPSDDSPIFARYDLVIADLPTSDISLDYTDSQASSKIIKFTESEIGVFDDTQNYYIFGYINNRYNIRNELESETIFLSELKLESIIDNDKIILRSNSQDLLPTVKGISGAPVVNGNHKICGMVISANRITKHFTAIQMTRILQIINGIEEDGYI